MDLSKVYVYDLETYKDLFSFSVVRMDGKQKATFQVSKFKNEINRIIAAVDWFAKNDCYLLGFNNLGFDNPILQEVYKLHNSGKKITSQLVWKLAQKQIDSFKGEGFGNTVKEEDEIVKQLDIYKIMHYDNKAKQTSLKLLEFNMRMDNIIDLPYDIEEELTEEMIADILKYNEHDVEATRRFAMLNMTAIEFRLSLTEKYGKRFDNFNDTKIGKQYFQMKLEECGIKLYEFKNGKKVLRQTPRPFINIGECLFDYYDFKRPEFIAVKDWFSRQTITETKGVFSDILESDLGEVSKYAEMVIKRKKFKSKPTKEEVDAFYKAYPLGWIDEEQLKAMETYLDEDGKKQKRNKISYWGCWRVAETLNVVIDGFRADFGVGGIHGSVSSKIAKETKDWALIDADVGSMYPNIAISNKLYPAHLGVEFCDIYQDVYNQRKSYAKGTAENAMLKLGLNGVYGDSNNQYSIFYDPKYTMSVTINGQLSLCLLAEKLLEIGVKIVQLNTDGITVAIKRDKIDEYYSVCQAWEKQVGLQLEYAEYSKMYIRDVNNYIAVYTNGKLKNKGAYVWKDLEMHKNHSALVIPMIAETVMVRGEDLETALKAVTDPFLFVLRTKVPRNSKLILRTEEGDIPQQRICRYYPSTSGGKLIKVMPPLEGKEEKGDRELGIDTEYNVKTCNNMVDFSWEDLDYDYYINEIKKLIIT